MKYTQSVDLAVHALLYMAYRTPDQPVMIREIASHQAISESYLAKILQALAKTDLLISLRGKRGGYRLGRGPECITVGDIVRALDGDLAEFECSYEARQCPLGPQKCFLPSVFEEARKRMFEVLDTVTLEDLSLQLERIDQRIAWIGKN